MFLNKYKLLGAISGDIIGSTYEILNTNRKDFNLFRPFSRYTDDTVLTIATADCLLSEGDFSEFYKRYCRQNLGRGYGGRFLGWSLSTKKEPYNSLGNGSAMRVSPIAYVASSLEEALYLAKESAIVTHNHPEGIKGAQAIATSMYLAYKNVSKENIKEYIENEFKYEILTLDEFTKKGKPDTTCQNNVPQAISAFLESDDFETCIRNAISLGGDSDTVACMAGGIGEAFYKEIPEKILNNTYKKLNTKFIKIIDEFSSKYNNDNY